MSYKKLKKEILFNKGRQWPHMQYYNEHGHGFCHEINPYEVYSKVLCNPNHFDHYRKIEIKFFKWTWLIWRYVKTSNTLGGSIFPEGLPISKHKTEMERSIAHSERLRERTGYQMPIVTENSHENLLD